MRIKYKPFVADKDIVIGRGQVGTIESNLVNCYIGEWIVFKYELEGGHEGEVRFPIEYAAEHRLIVPANKFVEDNDFER